MYIKEMQVTSAMTPALSISCYKKLRNSKDGNKIQYTDIVFEPKKLFETVEKISMMISERNKKIQ